MNERKIRFPDINDIFEKAKSIDEIWTYYIQGLRKDATNLDSISCANKLVSLNAMRTTDNIRFLDSEFQEIKEKVREISQKHGIPIIVKRRQKSFLGVIEKLKLLVEEGYQNNTSIKSSLERLLDFIGIRIVLCTGPVDNLETVKLAYEVMNEILMFLFKEKSHELITLNYPKKKRVESYEEGMFVPEESMVLEAFQENVKDYIWRPKPGTLYQCLHAVTMNANRQILELQVRTMAMDIRAEFGSAIHSDYKKLKYGTGDGEVVDLTKVHIPGFCVLPTGEIYDIIGLTQGIDPLNLLS